MGVTAICRDEIRQALGEDLVPAGPIAAAKFPHGQVDPDGPRPPSQVRQVALVAPMHGNGMVMSPNFARLVAVHVNQSP
jgi:hypothetical protein